MGRRASSTDIREYRTNNKEYTMSYMDEIMKEAGASGNKNTKPAETQQAETTPAKRKPPRPATG